MNRKISASSHIIGALQALLIREEATQLPHSKNNENIEYSPCENMRYFPYLAFPK